MLHAGSDDTRQELDPGTLRLDLAGLLACMHEAKLKDTKKGKETAILWRRIQQSAWATHKLYQGQTLLKRSDAYVKFERVAFCQVTGALAAIPSDYLYKAVGMGAKRHILFDALSVFVAERLGASMPPRVGGKGRKTARLTHVDRSLSLVPKDQVLDAILQLSERYPVGQLASMSTLPGAALATLRVPGAAGTKLAKTMKTNPFDATMIDLTSEESEPSSNKPGGAQTVTVDLGTLPAQQATDAKKRGAPQSDGAASRRSRPKKKQKTDGGAQAVESAASKKATAAADKAAKLKKAAAAVEKKAKATIAAAKKAAAAAAKAATAALAKASSEEEKKVADTAAGADSDDDDKSDDDGEEGDEGDDEGDDSDEGDEEGDDDDDEGDDEGDDSDAGDEEGDDDADERGDTDGAGSADGATVAVDAAEGTVQPTIASQETGRSVCLFGRVRPTLFFRSPATTSAPSSVVAPSAGATADEGTADKGADAVVVDAGAEAAVDDAGTADPLPAGDPAGGDAVAEGDPGLGAGEARKVIADARAALAALASPGQTTQGRHRGQRRVPPELSAWVASLAKATGAEALRAAFATGTLAYRVAAIIETVDRWNDELDDDGHCPRLYGPLRPPSMIAGDPDSSGTIPLEQSNMALHVSRMYSPLVSAIAGEFNEGLFVTLVAPSCDPDKDVALKSAKPLVLAHYTGHFELRAADEWRTKDSGWYELHVATDEFTETLEEAGLAIRLVSPASCAANAANFACGWKDIVANATIECDVADEDALVAPQHRKAQRKRGPTARSLVGPHATILRVAHFLDQDLPSVHLRLVDGLRLRPGVPREVFIPAPPRAGGVGWGELAPPGSFTVLENQYSSWGGTVHKDLAQVSTPAGLVSICNTEWGERGVRSYNLRTRAPLPEGRDAMWRKTHDTGAFVTKLVRGESIAAIHYFADLIAKHMAVPESARRGQPYGSYQRWQLITPIHVLEDGARERREQILANRRSPDNSAPGWAEYRRHDVRDDGHLKALFAEISEVLGLDYPTLGELLYQFPAPSDKTKPGNEQRAHADGLSSYVNVMIPLFDVNAPTGAKIPFASMLDKEQFRGSPDALLDASMDELVTNVYPVDGDGYANFDQDNLIYTAPRDGELGDIYVFNSRWPHIAPARTVRRASTTTTDHRGVARAVPFTDGGRPFLFLSYPVGTQLVRDQWTTFDDVLNTEWLRQVTSDARAAGQTIDEHRRAYRDKHRRFDVVDRA